MIIRRFYKKEGTIILLALFVLFFTASIITIIYSYNSRIFKLAKEEKINYNNFYNSSREANTNLYMIKLLQDGFIFKNWEWDKYYKLYINGQIRVYKSDGTRKEPKEIDTKDIKTILLYDTENTIEYNIKKNLQSKFNIYSIEFSNRIRRIIGDLNDESPSLKVEYKSIAKIKIKTKINDRDIIEEIEYPINMTIEYSIKKEGDPFPYKVTIGVYQGE